MKYNAGLLTYEEARVACTKAVTGVGIEPTTYGLKVRCSTD